MGDGYMPLISTPLPAPVSAWVMAGDTGVDSSCREGIEVVQGRGKSR